MIEIRRTGVNTTSDSRSQYDKLYSEQGIHQPESFYLWILHLLPRVHGARLLDVSCGEGRLLRHASRSGLVAYGLDLSYSAVEAASMNNGCNTAVVGDGEALPFADECFDFVTSIGSLEHYLNPDAGMREIARVLRKTGFACILLPNSFGLLWNIYWVFKTGSIYVDHQPIQRYATVNQWKDLLETNGLKVVKVHKYDSPLPRTWGDFWRYLKRPRKLIVTILSFGIPINLASCHVFICSRRDAT